MPFREFSSGIGTVSYPLPSFETVMEVLRPGATWKSYNGNIVDWNDPSGQEPPTHDEIVVELNRETEVYNQYAWERSRKDAFPKIEDQLDTLYHDITAGKFGEDAKTSAWYVGISSIKSSYPSS